MKVISTIIQWLIIVAIFAAAIAIPFGKINITGTLTGPEVILFALAISFTLVEVVKLFPCMKCVTGWSALILALLFHTPFAWMYVFVGLFAGALFSAIKMRWL